MSLPPINIKIGANTVDLNSALDKVARDLNNLEKISDNVANKIGQFGDKATALGNKMLPVSAGVAAMGAAAAGIINGTASAGVEIGNMARLAGTSAEEFQKLAAGANTVGIDSQKLADIYKDMNDRVGDFLSTGGGPMADFFDKIGPKVGVTADDFARLSGPESLQLFVDSLEKAGASQQEMTFYMEAMASDATALIPLLSQNGEQMRSLGESAQEAGAIMKNETVVAAQEFQAQMTELKQGMVGARNEIGGALLPVALELAQAFQESVVPAIVAVADGIAGAIDWFGQLPGPVQDAAGIVAGALGVGGPVLLAVGALSTALKALLIGTGPIGLFIGAAALLTAAWLKWGDDIKKVVGDSVEWIKGKFTEAVDFFDTLPERFKAFGTAIMDGLRDGINDAWEGVKNSIMEKVDWLPNWVKERLGIASPSKIFKDFGKAIMDGLRDGIDAAWEAVKASIKDKVDWLPNWVKERLGIASPSKVFQGIGQNIGEGLALGLQESSPLAQDAMQQMTDGLMGQGGGEVEGPSMGEGDAGEVGANTGGMGAVIEKFRAHGQSIGQKFAEGIAATRGLVGQAVTEMSDTVSGGAAGMAKNVVDALGEMFKGSKPIAMAQALINTYQGITKALSTKDYIGAATIAAKGFAAVRAISSAQPGSGASAGAGAATGAASAPAQPMQTTYVNLQGDVFSRASVKGLLEQLQSDIGRGGRLILQ